MAERLPHSMHLAIRLQHEWNRMVRQPRHVRTINSWSLPAPSVASLDDVLRRAGYGWAGDDNSDAYLGELVRLATTEFLAARIVLQRVLPGLAHHARRRGGNHPAATAVAFDDLVGWAWELIRTYPLERRPRWIAANIVRDSNYQAFTRPARLRQLTQVSLGDHDRAAEPPTVEPLFELIEFLRGAQRAGANDADIELVTRIANARSIDDVAAELNVTDRTVRSRRAAAVARLREIAA